LSDTTTRLSSGNCGIPQRNSYNVDLKIHKHILKSGFFPCLLFVSWAPGPWASCLKSPSVCSKFGLSWFLFLINYSNSLFCSLSQAGPSASNVDPKKAEMLKRAPKIQFDQDLTYWGKSEKDIEPPTVVR
jgi:hypothetical protein